MTRVRAEDLRPAGLCPAGARRWFRARGLDWAAFLKDGIAAEDLQATGDVRVPDVVAVAEARKDRHG